MKTKLKHVFGTCPKHKVPLLRSKIGSEYCLKCKREKEQMKKLTEGQIKIVCREFLENLGESATNDIVFSVLAEMALSEYGIELKAEQRGMQGTFVHFVDAGGLIKDTV
jgi:hypothetical protein